MRLKKLEIRGFKSFANQTTLHFSENVTGVVGPNGSGKSNVVDAIRWALGEQRSKDLRLEKMSDVLFNGTKTRKRTGMAQVTITFENDKGLLPLEYSELSISRHLYRSGQSEYRLNNVTCRLKDITSLLANTGIGSNNYAIIELGMVDDILQDKNNARRRMFEQSAGIYSFKQRKHETTLKLKATNDDLERVQDLLHEIEGNMKTLEKQARRAKKYLKLKGNYRESSILLASYNLSAYKEKYAQLKEQIQSNQAEQTEIYAKINSQSADIERRKMEIQQSEGSLTEIQKSVRGVENELADLQSKISLLANEIKFTEQNLEKEKGQAATNAERIADLKSKLIDLEKAIGEGKTQLGIKGKEAQEVAAQRDVMSSKMKNVEEVKNELLLKQNELNGEITSLERTLAVELNRQQSTSQLIEHTQDEIAHRTSRLEEFMQSKKAQENELTEVIKGVEILENQFASDQTVFNNLRDKIEKATTELIGMNRTLDARQNEYDLLKNMIENLEGYPDSIKFLAKEHKWNRKAALLSEIIICEDAYKNAIESVLEPYLNFYVVKGRQEAVAAITLLKDAQKGRASFFDAEAFKPGQQRSDWKSNGFVSALDVIEPAEEYRGLIESLLANIYVHDGTSPFDSSTTASEHITLVAHDGHRIQSTNRLSGGSPGLFDGLKIGRKKNLDLIKEEMADISDKIEKLSIEKNRFLSEQENIDLFKVQNQLDEKRSSLAAMESEFKNIKLRVVEIEQQIQDDKNRIVALNEQKTNSERVSKEASDKISTRKEAHEKIISELSGESSVIDRLSLEMSELNDLFSQKNIAFVQAEGQLTNLGNEHDMISNRIVELDNEVQHIKEKDIELSDKIKVDKNRLEELQKNLKLMFLEKDDTSQKLSKSEQEYFSAKNLLLESEKSFAEFNRKNSDFQYLIGSLKDEYNDIKIKLNDVSQRVKVEFNISTPELMQIEIPEDLNGEELTTQVERMRMKLYGFGEVNPLAVEAYHEMSERHDGIASQKKDIEDAQQSLLDTIKELEEQATIQFMEAFEKIKEHFKEIFRSLFSAEDACDLILLNPDNPLESPIEVTAKPKGKRPLSLSQLSGGEKTLTATALLFALYLLKPAPFCIFDEVDAPLDDANIQKFNNIIQTFSGDSQFVIITHNKLTMASVDVIYGVYMDEPGVSSVTPVDFRELKHEMIPLELSEN